MSLLSLEHITTGYGKREVLHDISLDIPEGEVVLLIGSNGSGKSTLLKCIYGLLKPWNKEGKIIFDGQSIVGKPASSMLKRGLVYVPQKDNVFEDLTVKENLEISGLKLKKRVRKERIEAVFEQFPALKPFRKRTPFKLSGGERQMLAISMGFLHQPRLMLLDEPGSGLAPGLVHEVLEKLKTINQEQGITMLIVEHRVKESLQIADRVFALKLGQLLWEFDNSMNFRTRITMLDVSELNEVFI